MSSEIGLRARRLALVLFLIVFLILFLVTVVTPLAASEGREIDYAELNTILSAVNQFKSPLIESQFRLEIFSQDISLDEIKAWLVEDDQVLREIRVDETSGLIELPVFEKARAKQLALRLNQGKEAVVLTFSANIKSPSA